MMNSNFGKAGKLVLSLFVISIFSGCVGQQGGTTDSLLTVNVLGGGVEDVTITAKMMEFARKNTDFGWQMVVQPSTNIRDFTAEIYDKGLFTEVEAPVLTKDEIKANRTETFPIKYRMGDPGLADSTDIKFRAFYKSNFTLSTTVAVLSETEYYQRKTNNALGEIAITSWSSVNPLKITVTWSETEPLVDEQEVHMYVDYQNGGAGFIEKLSAGDVVFTIPSNLAVETINPCDDYRIEGSKAILDRNLDFVQKKAKKSTCTFTAKASGPIDSQTLIGTAAYDYETDGKVTVPIIQK